MQFPLQLLLTSVPDERDHQLRVYKTCSVVLAALSYSLDYYFSFPGKKAVSP